MEEGERGEEDKMRRCVEMSSKWSRSGILARQYKAFSSNVC